MSGGDNREGAKSAEAGEVGTGMNADEHGWEGDHGVHRDTAVRIDIDLMSVVLGRRTGVNYCEGT